MKKFAPIILAVGVLLTWLAFRSPETPDTRTSERTDSPPTATGAGAGISNTASSPDSFSARLLNLTKTGATPAEALAELKAMEAEDPAAFTDALISMENMSPDVLQDLLPLIGDAFTLWPEVRGAYLAMLVYPYTNLAPDQAAAWGKDFLVTQDRADLVVAGAVANLAATDEKQALELIEQLPQAARNKAVGSLADSVDVSDFDHLAELSQSLDADGSALLTKRLFERIGFDDLDGVAAWLAENPGTIPGAAAAIGMHMALGKEKVEAIEWADSLTNDQARAEAIAAVYRQWSKGDPEGAVVDILTNYPDSLELMEDAFQGAAEQHGGGATEYWETASSIENSSARAYATAGLIKPMIMQVGLEKTEARIASLPAGSVEREVAEMTLAQTITQPEVAHHLKQQEKIGAEEPVTE